MPSIAPRSTRCVTSGDKMRGRQVKQDRGESAETRIGKQITPQPNGCWLWGNPDVKRPNVTIHGKRTSAYRFVYETLRGPVPEGHDLHHECETPLCCNPAHLKPMLPGDHIAHHHRERKIRAA